MLQALYLSLDENLAKNLRIWSIIILNEIDFFLKIMEKIF